MREVVCIKVYVRLQSSGNLSLIEDEAINLGLDADELVVRDARKWTFTLQCLFVVPTIVDRSRCSRAGSFIGSG